MSVILADSQICTFARSQRQTHHAKAPSPKRQVNTCSGCGHPVSVSGLCGKCRVCPFCCGCPREAREAAS